MALSVLEALERVGLREPQDSGPFEAEIYQPEVQLDDEPNSETRTYTCLALRYLAAYVGRARRSRICKTHAQDL